MEASQKSYGLFQLCDLFLANETVTAVEAVAAAAAAAEAVISVTENCICA